VGLKSDGTVVAVGENSLGQCNVGDWTNITQVAAGIAHTVGLRDDGTVVAAGLESELARWDLGVIKEKSQTSCLLIGRIVAAVVTAGLVIFFVRGRRRKTA
jgi:alpha-tubulin suppressor-like RCC1 family protein